MDRETLRRLVDEGESVDLEFKRCGDKPGRDVFETICAFANRQGGSILLGVLDDGAIEGVQSEKALLIKRNVVNVVANPELFNIPPSLEFEEVPYEQDRVVIRVIVSIGPSLYSFKGVVYDRMEDSDVRVRGDAQKAAMIVRKQSIYTERTVYPWIDETKLDVDVLDVIREEVYASNPAHPWLRLGRDDLLRAMRLMGRDPLTGAQGYNLAAVMLLGKEDTILDIAPTYRTDCVVRRTNTERYDDRVICKGNIVQSYDELVGFCKKWLPDAFALEGARRVSVRDIIVRELVCNTLIHREFSSPRIAQIVIGAEGIYTRNASRAMWSGRISLETLDPTPKNPIIANVFTQMGRSEELGSGTRALYKYSALYTGGEPILEEGDCFTAFVPVPTTARRASEGGHRVGRPEMLHEVKRVANLLLHDKGVFSASEVASQVDDVGTRTVRRYLKDMVDGGELVIERRGRATVYRRPDDCNGV